MFWHNTSILISSLNNKCDLMVVTVKFWVLKAKDITTLKTSNEPQTVRKPDVRVNKVFKKDDQL